MWKNWWRNVTNTKGIRRSSKLQQVSFIPYSPQCHLLNGGLFLGIIYSSDRSKKMIVEVIIYLTKWIETIPLAIIMRKNTENFMWKTSCASMNDLQFSGSKGVLQKEYPFDICFSVYSQTNGLTELDGQTILCLEFCFVESLQEVSKDSLCFCSMLRWEVTILCVVDCWELLGEHMLKMIELLEWVSGRLCY